MNRPTIVCLCGSVRFLEAFRQAEFDETLAGRVVLTIGCDTKSDEMLKLPPGSKEKLEALHLKKVALADEVLILNVDGYIGESTRRELTLAIMLGRSVRFLEEPSDALIPSLFPSGPESLAKDVNWIRDMIYGAENPITEASPDGTEVPGASSADGVR